MTIPPAQKSAIKDWLDEAMEDRFCKRMVMPAEQQAENGALFPVEGREVPFAQGLAMFKYAASKSQYGSRKMQRDIPELLRSQKMGAEEYASLESWMHRDQPQQRDMGRYYAALVEVQCGCYTLSEAEFAALKQPPHLPEFAKGLAAGENKPSVSLLKDVTFADFKSVVGEVLAEHGLPTALVTHDPAALPVQTIARAALDGRVVNLDGLQLAIDAAQRTLEMANTKASEAEKLAQAARSTAIQANRALVRLQAEMLSSKKALEK